QSKIIPSTQRDAIHRWRLHPAPLFLSHGDASDYLICTGPCRGTAGLVLSPMNLQRKRLLPGILVLALLGLVVWIATRDQAAVTMGSGAVITLYQVTYGKEHRIVYGSLWQRLRSRLPQKWFGPSGGL